MFSASRGLLKPLTPARDVVAGRDISVRQPGRGASEPPVASAQKAHIALSRAYNHLAILLTQGLKAENGSGRQVVAVTGKVSGSRLSVCAITEIEELPSLSSVTFT